MSNAGWHAERGDESAAGDRAGADGSRESGSVSLGQLSRRFGPILREQAGLFAVGILFVLLSLGTSLAEPMIIRVIVDRGIEGGQLDLVGRLALLLGGVLLVEGLAVGVLYRLFYTASFRVVSRVRERFHEHMVQQEIAFYDGASVGDLVSRTMNDTGRIFDLIAIRLPDALRFSLLGVAAAGMLFYTSPMLTLALALAWPPIAYGTSKLGNQGRLAARAVQEAEAGVAAVTLESFAGIRTVRAFGQERAESDRVRRSLIHYLAVSRKMVSAMSTLEGFATVASKAAVVLGIWLGGQLIVSGELTPGALVSFILYGSLVVRSTKNLSTFAAEFLRARGITERIFWYMERETRMPVSGGLRPDEMRGDLRLEDVSFGYSGASAAPSLFDVSLEIRRGEEVAVVGPSGSGKSTLVQLMARMYDPSEGRVLLDGRDLRELDPSWLRERVVLVSQDATLFSRSIADNIRYGREDAEDEEVIAAAEAATARPFIEAQPKGFDTEIGDAGSRLSGGQRQRIGVARALLREPRVVIFDEATAALDSDSEAKVKDSLRKLPYEPTVIIVAHRLSTVADMGRVLVVADGRVVADGTHAELMQRSPAYRDLVENQLVSE